MVYNVIHKNNGQNIVYRNPNGSIKIYHDSSGGSFSPVAFVLTAGTSYTVPTGATSMKAWVIGGGGGGAYDSSGCGGYDDGFNGGESVKTYSVTGGTSVAYSVGGAGIAGPGDYSGTSGGTTTLTYGGVTITATGGCSRPICSTDGTGSGGDFNRSFFASGVLDFQGRVAAITLSGSSLNAGFKGTAMDVSATNGSPGGIVLYFT
jgi:hypothetical protein